MTASVDCSQGTVESSQSIEDTSQATVETFCGERFIQSDFEGALNLKVDLENLKSQIIADIKDLIFNEISSLIKAWFPLGSINSSPVHGPKSSSGSTKSSSLEIRHPK